MKKTVMMLIGASIISASICRAQFTAFQYTMGGNMIETISYFNQNSPGFQLDSNEQYKFLNDGFVLQGGQIKLARNGSLYRQDSPVTLKNGTILLTDGLIKMTNGSTPKLKENEFIDLNGNIRTLQKQINFIEKGFPVN